MKPITPPPSNFFINLKIVCSFFVVLLFFAFSNLNCKKSNKSESTQTISNIKLTPKPNPFSYSNIKKIRSKLNLKSINSEDADRLFTYAKFDPQEVSQEDLAELESYEDAIIVNFPLANGEIYDESLNIDEKILELISDDKCYMVFKNTPSESTNGNLTKSKSKEKKSLKTIIENIDAKILDTLYLPDDEETDDQTVQLTALKIAGFSTQKIETEKSLFGLGRNPSGFVRYRDADNGTMVNVEGIQVWALHFGVPVSAYTNVDGWYKIGKKFVAGTFMGTKAKNDRVNVKPFNTQGGFFRVVAQLITNFIIGSVHNEGWVGAGAMRNDVNINFNNHNQARYWAQIINCVSKHDRYCANDRINNAPSQLVVYAHWGDGNGNSSAPMLGHLQYNGLSVILSSILGVENITDAPNLFNLLTGLLPDVTIRMDANSERQFYCSRLEQTVFHELGHASHFRNAGTVYWTNYIVNILSPKRQECRIGYGCGNETNFGFTQLGESWAEFIGTEHARRLKPNGMKFSRQLGFVRFDNAIERELWFDNEWIPSGVFNDLIDTNNTFGDENNWDQIGGLTIAQLYSELRQSVNSICDYRNAINSRYTWLGANNVNNIFNSNFGNANFRCN